MLRVCVRLLNTPINRLTKQVFMWDWNLKERNWSAEIGSISDDVDLSYLNNCVAVYDGHKSIAVHCIRLTRK